MPTLDEKLKTFDKKINDDAILSRNLIRTQLRQESDQRMSGVKEEIDLEAEREYRKEARRAVIEKDSRISKATVDARKLLMKARSEIIESILAELSEGLAVFTQTSSYYDYLDNNAKEALTCAYLGATGGSGDDGIGGSLAGYGGGGNYSNGLRLYLTPKDYIAHSAKMRELARGVEILPGNADMIGGVKVENPSKGLYVDNTLKKKVELCIDELFLISDLNIGK